MIDWQATQSIPLGLVGRWGSESEGGIWVVRGKRVEKEGRGMQREGELMWVGGGNENERRRGSVETHLRTDVERQRGPQNGR